MAFVVIQHLDPTQKGMMPELLQRVSSMPVIQAKDRLKVKPDCVYVIPPNRDLSILHDCLHLLEPVAPRGLRLPIDFFFRTLADDRSENAIGVVLSGMGSDGTLGLRAIKECGGLALVQDPMTAKFDSMPRSAIDAGLADIIASPEELPLRIIEILRHIPQLHAGRTIVSGGESFARKSAFDKICILLRARTRHDFSLYKKASIYRRIERRMAIHQMDRIADYLRYLQETPQEVDLLFKELLIGVTRFFRDSACWAALQEHALPELFAAHPFGANFRAWVAGCSTGEEAYSLAMCFCEVLQRLKPLGGYSLQIFATDIDSDAIERGRQGLYPANIAADVSEERLERFFVETPNNGGSAYRVSKTIREMIVFASHNLIIDPPFTKLDILLCRNLLIYMSADLQKKVLPLFHYCLKPGGILMQGSAESVGDFKDMFQPIEGKAHLFRRMASPIRALDLEVPPRYFSAKSESLRDVKPEAAAARLQNLSDQVLLQQFSPSAVLVNAAGDLVNISGRITKYLEPAAGKVNWNIYAMACEALSQELAVALPKALRTGERVVCRNLPINVGDEERFVDLTVHPIEEPVTLNRMALIVFSDVAAQTLPLIAVGTNKLMSDNAQEKELKRALAQLQREQRALRDEMRLSLEELKATNEELQSMNEELITSREEMQSLNEELQTTNIELEVKVDELSLASNDMKNMLNSIDLAVVFLDKMLHVRRFTSHVTRLFKLIPGDVGRPLSDIVTDLVYPLLPHDAMEVMNSLEVSEREIVTIDGRWYLVRIMPYRTLENVIDGVVMTFSDISRAKMLEADLRAVADPAATDLAPAK